MGRGNTAAAGQGQFVAREWNALVIIRNQIIPALFPFILQPPFFCSCTFSHTFSRNEVPAPMKSHCFVELLGLSLCGVQYSALILCSSSHSRVTSTEHSNLLSFLLSGTPWGQMIPLRFWICIMSATAEPFHSHSPFSPPCTLHPTGSTADFLFLL